MYSIAGQGMILFFLCIAVASVGARAQETCFVNSAGQVIAAHSDPERFEVRPGAPSFALKSGNLTWNIFYVDVLESTGVGFDDPVNGPDRRAVAESVLTYINDVLKENTGAAIDVVFEESQTDGGGYLAAAGTLFIAEPGFQGGFALEHIVLGEDPSLAYYDIYCTFDFGYDWYTGDATPGFGQFDLYSVLLHEMTHGLGFLSISNQNGESVVGDGAFSFYDRLIETGNSNDSWDNDTAEFIGSTDWLTGQDGGLVLNGVNAAALFGALPPLYAPSPWQGGSSLSHWDTGGKITGGAVMEPSIAPRQVRRTYASVDLGALADLGYTHMGDDVPTPAADLDAPSYMVSEADGAVVLTVTLTNAPGIANSASVDYEASGGEAAPGDDYQAASGTLSFGPVDVAKTITITINEDGAIEGDETFILTLSNPQGCTLADVNNPAVVTIFDNDSDTDGDGISDYDEINGTFGYATNPNMPDTDGDGFDDFTEVTQGRNPLDPNDFPVPVPSSGALGLLLLAACLTVAGAFALTRQLRLTPISGRSRE